MIHYTGKASPKTLPITLGTVGGLLIILIVCLFAIPNKLKSAILRRPGNTVQNEGRNCSFDLCLARPNEIRFSFTLLWPTQKYTKTSQNRRYWSRRKFSSPSKNSQKQRIIFMKARSLGREGLVLYTRYVCTHSFKQWNCRTWHAAFFISFSWSIWYFFKGETTDGKEIAWRRYL